MSVFLPCQYGTDDRVRIVTAPAPSDTGVVITALKSDGSKLIVVYVRPIAGEKSMVQLKQRADRMAKMPGFDVRVERLSGHGIFAAGASKRRSKKGYSVLVYEAADKKKSDPDATIPLSAFAGGMKGTASGIKVELTKERSRTFEAQPVAKLAGVGYRLTEDLIQRLDHSQRDWVLTFPPNVANLYATDAWGETLKGDFSAEEVANIAKKATLSKAELKNMATTQTSGDKND